MTAAKGEVRITSSTDESGSYRFTDLEPGQWEVTVEMFGFAASSKTLQFPEDKAASWNLELRARTQSANTQAGRSQQGFERMRLNRTAESEVMAALESAVPETAVQSQSLLADANQSFLVSGSLSRGLQFEQMAMARPMFGGGFGGPSPGGASQGPTAPGFNSTQGEVADAGGGGGPRGGFSGGGGPRGGFAGRRGGGADGPRGNREGPGGRRPPWMGERGVSTFGNRRFGRQNAIRGRAFFSLNNSALDARSYSLTGQEIAQPSYAQYRFGISAGGQLRIPKLIDSENTFVFLNYSGTRSRNPFSANATVPSAAERAGDFSQSIAQGPVSIFDPTTLEPFPGNVIPSSRIDPAAEGLLPFLPLSNQTSAVRNYQLVTSVPRNTNNLGARISHSLTRRDRLSFSLNVQERNSEAAQLYGFRDETAGRGLSSNLGWTRTLTSTLINAVQLTFSRNRTETVPEFAYGPNVAEELGIQGTSQTPEDYGPPNLSFTNFGALSDGRASLSRTQAFGVTESVTWIRGKHNLKFGFEFRRNQLNTRVNEEGRGAFSFSGLVTSGFDEAGNPAENTGFDLADMLLGFPQSAAVRFGESALYFRGSNYSAYVQDDWRAGADFSINFGLRYEYSEPLFEKFGRMSNLDFAPGFTAIGVVAPGTPGPYTGEFSKGLVDPDRNNFSPRIGIAWRPWKERSLRVRAGYGIYYNGSVYNQMASRLGQQPPFAWATTLTTSLSNPLTLTQGLLGSPATEINNTLAVARDYRVGYAQTWNLSLQHDLPFALMLEAGYLGTKGTRLDMQRLPNQAPPGSPLDSEDRRPIPSAVGFTFESAEGNSVYHAGQLRLMRRFRRGLSFNVLYTWAKSIDNVSTYGGGQAVVVQNDDDLRAERGLSSFDQRHAVSVNFVASSPVGSGPSSLRIRGVWGKLLEDWTLSGGVTGHSGTPLTATVLGNRTDAGGTGVVGSGRADATGESVDSNTGFFNLAAFTVPPASEYGNAGRNTIPGPRFFVLNLSLGRSFPVFGERRRLEFRVEANNALNSVNFSRLGTTVNASNFGLATGTSSMRTVTAQMSFRF